MLTLLIIAACTGSGGGESKPGPSPVDETAAPDGETDESADETGETGETGEPSETGETGPVLDLRGRVNNVLMISLDTARRDHLSGYAGALGDTTPNLGAFLERSLVLDDHYSCSNWTYHAMACVQGARTPLEYDFVPGHVTRTIEPMPEGVRMVPEVLSELGFRTGLVSANKYLSEEIGLHNGFDTHTLVHNTEGEVVVDLALEMVGEIASEPDVPWYAHVHFIDPHDPYDPPAAYLGALEGLEPIPYDLTSGSGYTQLVWGFQKLTPEVQERVLQHVTVRYLAELRYFDDQLQRLLDGLAEAGALDDTLVVFWIDHGEQFFDHDEFGHTQSLHAEENQSLVAFQAPGLAAGRWTEPTIHEDIWPIVFAALGLPLELPTTGRPLSASPRPLYTFTGSRAGASMAIIEDGQKLIYEWESGGRELYDRGADPKEEEDLYDSEDATSQALWALLLPEIQRADDVMPYVDAVGLEP